MPFFGGGKLVSFHSEAKKGKTKTTKKNQKQKNDKKKK